LLAMIRIVLFIFFSVTLLGQSSVSLKVIEQARSQLKVMGKVDLISLHASGLTFFDSSKDVEDLMKVLLSRKENLQIKKLAADGMSQYRSKDSLEAMGRFAKKNRNYNEFTFPLFLSQGAVPEDDVLWANLIKARDQSVAQLAIKELGGSLVRSPKIADALIQRLKNPKDSLSFKKDLIKKFTEIPTNKAAVSLAWLLGNEKYKNAAHETLTKTTGQSFEYDISKWQNWIRQNKQFTPNVLPAKEFPSREVVESRRRSSDQYPNRYAENKHSKLMQEDIVLSYPMPGQDRVSRSLYGVEVEGKTILFFLDCSGSMMGRSYELLKEEMLYMAETMDEGYSIGLVFFPFQQKTSILEVSKNNRSFKNRLQRFLNDKAVGGPSPLVEAMTYAYRELLDNDYHEVDTIYIITDGHIGNPTARDLIYDLNAEKRLPIHTICIRGNTNFLNGVATDNNGKSYLVQ